MSGRMRAMIGGLVVVAVLAGGALWWAQRDSGPGAEFVTADGEQCMLEGGRFYAAGTNNYRPMFLPPASRATTTRPPIMVRIRPDIRVSFVAVTRLSVVEHRPRRGRRQGGFSTGQDAPESPAARAR